MSTDALSLLLDVLSLLLALVAFGKDDRPDPPQIQVYILAASGARLETPQRKRAGMSWQPAYGGAVLALRDHAGRIVATIDGPHPAGYVLTTFMPERVTSVHGTLEVAQGVGDFLHAKAAQADRGGGARIAPQGK